MFNNGGHNHVIQNNIFALSANQAMWPYFEKRPNTFRRNIVYLTQGALFIPYGENSLNDRVAAKQSLGEWDWNLYWHTGGADQLHFYRSSFALWQELNLDKHSLIEDPLFVNSKVADFGLQPNSPAAKIDFRAIDIRHVGLYGEPSWIRQVGHSNCVPAPLPASHSR